MSGDAKRELGARVASAHRVRETGRVRRLAYLAFLAALAGCGWMSEPCPCGRSFERDPWSEEPFALGANHAVGVHCICRCGDGEPVLEDPSASCELYERPCVDAEGVRTTYVCR